MTERKNVIFDSTILNTVQACAEKADLSFNKDLKPAHTATPLEEGDLLHKMYEFYNQRLKEHGTDILYDNERFKANQDEAVAHGERYSMDLELSPSETSEVIFQFIEHTKFCRMDGVKILDVEKAFIVELYKDDELGIFYTGKIDRMTDTPNYGICPRDYKKASRNETPTSLSNQFTGYAYATSSKVIFIDKVGFQRTLTPEQRFPSYPLLYTDFQLNQWKEDTIWWGRQYAYYIEEGTWPRNRTSCDKYGGCIFKGVCEAGSLEGRELAISSNFIVGEHWDPTAVLVKKEKV